MDEAALKYCKTLDEYNKFFNVWLTECYHTREHGSLNGTTPELAYKSSKSPLRFVEADTIASAFMRVERRKVDKSGCISFGGKKYEVSALLVGRTVDVAYDPNNLQTLTVEYDGDSWRVKELQIGEHTGPRSKLPKSMSPVVPQTSRVLDEKEKQHAKRQDVVRRAIRYGGLKGGEAVV